MRRESKKGTYVIHKALNHLVFVGEICGVRKNLWSRNRRKEWVRESGGELSHSEKAKARQYSQLFSDLDHYYVEAQYLSDNGKGARRALEGKRDRRRTE